MTQSVVITIGNTLISSTPKAVCLKVNGKDEWFPIDSVRYSLEKGKMELPIWMAKKKGFLQNATPTTTPPARQAEPPKQVITRSPEVRNTPQPKQALIDELSKIRSEVKLLNDRLLAIFNELSRGN